VDVEAEFEVVLVLGENGFTGLFSFTESPFGASLTLPDRPDVIRGCSEKKGHLGAFSALSDPILFAASSKQVHF